MQHIYSVAVFALVWSILVVAAAVVVMVEAVAAVDLLVLIIAFADGLIQFSMPL